ncbi:PepSY domain-containing protein [Parashewanella spongiae]|uniref:PepSY domain-containing protein n=1 Tax=Parashewanella spongiae TaxID=342950 RepID=A0A3A6TAK4_9GAMM|nr:PepSY-associated TM helix domain-containing protein [Parashewanella spongiae]MCL1078793.1 PepSY domain-containing protein [Parashewanella spongiae]RJY11953.1 PepSY domain-containing protein [Parashewanella spongiae]
MKGNFRRSMIWLHTYSGLLLSWLVFTVFVTGTLSYYAEELNVWMQPERLQQQNARDPINLAVSTLKQEGAGAEKWSINLGSLRDQKLQISWQLPGQSRRQQQRQTLSESEVESRDTVGGDFFVHFHYALELRDYGGRYLSGIAAFIMLVGVFSGIFTHRRFFKDFFSLRWKNIKRGLTDVHAIMGIVTIPFCFMICASALLFYLSMYVPTSANLHYDKGYRELSQQVSPKSFIKAPSGEPSAPISDISAIITQVNERWSEPNSVSFISYQYPYDKNGYLVFYRNKSQALSRQSETLTFDATSQQLIHSTEPARIPKQISYIFLGLHEAKFAPNGLRFMLFLLGVFSCALIATGSILWLNQRIASNKMHLGSKMVAWLNQSVLGGLAVAIMSLFYANRILPTDMIEREATELSVFFGSWLITAVVAAWLRSTHWWSRFLFLIGAGFLLLPLIDLLLPSHYLLAAITSENWQYLGVSLGFMVVGIGTLWLANFLRIRQVMSNELLKTAGVTI